MHISNTKGNCKPICRIPDKRDFMDVNPERSAEDFYRNYDPMVGIGTAIILILFFFVVTIKTFIRWMVRRWHLLQYQKAATKLARIATNAAAAGAQQESGGGGDGGGRIEVTVVDGKRTGSSANGGTRGIG